MTPSPSPLQFNGPDLIPGISGLAYAVGVLFLVCVVAYVSVKLLYGKGTMGRFGFARQIIKVVDRFTLSSNSYLLTVEVAGKFYLLGVTQQSITTLAELDGEILTKNLAWVEQNGGAATFNSYLTALSRKWKKSKKEPPNVV